MSKPLTVEQLRCLELARIIREGLEGVRLNMATYRGDCGTAACIAGHVICKYEPERWAAGFDGEVYLTPAAALLGLNEHQAWELFLPWNNGGPCSCDITPAMAAATLENYALTGKVEWPKL